jgi:outer membrane murein-binding lipoprotein Lpp
MATTRFSNFTLLVLIAFFTAGCVSKNKYDQVTSELNNAQGQIQTLMQDNDTLKNNYAQSRSDYDTLKSDYDTLKNNYDSLKGDYETLQSDYDSTKTDLEATQASLENTKTNLKDTLTDISALEEKTAKAKAKVEVLKSMFLPSLSGEYANYSEAEYLIWFLEWRTVIEATNDSSLQEKFDNLVIGGFTDKGTSDFFIYLIEAIYKDLE